VPAEILEQTLLRAGTGEGQQKTRTSGENKPRGGRPRDRAPYGASPSFRDPARFTYAHGGKDGHPYPADRSGNDRSIAILKQAVERARIIGDRDKMEFSSQIPSLFDHF